MPPLSSRMTKNQERNFRYRPGKAAAEEASSYEESESEEEQEAQSQAPVSAPKASTFPSQKKLAVDLSKTGQQGYVPPAPNKPDDDLEGFVTASESSEDEAADGSNEEDEAESSDEDESSSEDEPKKPMLAPEFMSKSKRAQRPAAASATPAPIDAEEIERRRKEKADDLLQAQLERDAAARAAGKKAWDDDDNINPGDEVDDTDDIDHEAEKAAWKLRELKRVRRDRLAIEEKEKEREEIERRRNMTAEEREAEDKAFIDAQQEERDGKGKMSYMQKYHHKGAFFRTDGEDQDEEVKAALNRDLAGARYADDVSKEVLPEYMKIRDMSKLGKKGATKYRDLKTEDTGRWADYGRKKREFDGVDDRFRPDDRRDGGRERTGANDMPVGERRRREDDGERLRDDKRARYD